MENSNQKKDFPFSTQLALASFTIGTMLFIGFKFLHLDFLVIVGIYFILFAAICNSLVAIYLIYELFTKKNKMETAIKLIILLSNIPITIIYISCI
ncbi:MAG: hypothetical protein QM535_08730 [Limnohabitans sp.]|nr:hypothetical protein [Limnohabitans sp.]